MLHSNERMDLIIEYMTSYEEKIKMANKNGLFDAAKMFELFAIEVSNVNTNYERKSDVDTQISNRVYAKKKISEIRDEYYMARDRYKSFCKSDKAVFDLYAGKDVRNCLVEFDVIIHNVFISGHSVGDVDDPLNNKIEIIRRKLINSMRNDIGTY